MTPYALMYPFEFRVFEMVAESKDKAHEKRLIKYSGVISRFLHDMNKDKKYNHSCMDDDYIDNWVRKNTKRKMTVQVFSNR